MIGEKKSLQVVGIVGGIGTGKTKVLRILESLGAVTVAADELSREVLAAGMPATKAVREVFGNEYFDAEGNLQRRKLAELIFADEPARRRLDAIVHPQMLDALKQRLEQWRTAGVQVAAVESAVLDEMGARPLVDVVLVVEAPTDVVLRRLMQRDGLSAEEVKARIAAHERLGLTAPPGDYRIVNDGGSEELHKQVEQFWRTIVS